MIRFVIGFFFGLILIATSVQAITVYCEPDSIQAEMDDVITISMMIDYVDSLGGAAFAFTYDSSILEYQSYELGDLWGDANVFSLLEEEYNILRLGCSVFSPDCVVEGSGTACQFTFQVIAANGSTDIEFILTGSNDRIARLMGCHSPTDLEDVQWQGVHIDISTVGTESDTWGSIKKSFEE